MDEDDTLKDIDEKVTEELQPLIDRIKGLIAELENKRARKRKEEKEATEGVDKIAQNDSAHTHESNRLTPAC